MNVSFRDQLKSVKPAVRKAPRNKRFVRTPSLVSTDVASIPFVNAASYNIKLAA